MEAHWAASLQDVPNTAFFFGHYKFYAESSAHKISNVSIFNSTPCAAQNISNVYIFNFFLSVVLITFLSSFLILLHVVPIFLMSQFLILLHVVLITFLSPFLIPLHVVAGTRTMVQEGRITPLLLSAVL